MPQPRELQQPRQRLADCDTLRSFAGRAGPAAVFTRFEALVDPYPDALPATPPAGFWPFMWAATLGLRRYIVAMVVFTAAIGVFEALLFAMLGNIVDWLARVAPARLWQDERSRLLALGAVLLGSMGLVALQSMFK